MEIIKKENFIIYVLALILFGFHIHRLFFTDFVVVTWYDYFGVYGISSLFCFISAFFWETLKPYYQKMSGQ